MAAVDHKLVSLSACRQKTSMFPPAGSSRFGSAATISRRSSFINKQLNDFHLRLRCVYNDDPVRPTAAANVLIAPTNYNFGFHKREGSVRLTGLAKGKRARKLSCISRLVHIIRYLVRSLVYKFAHAVYVYR